MSTVGMLKEQAPRRASGRDDSDVVGRVMGLGLDVVVETGVGAGAG
jgi:hypothetical protein